MKIGIVVHGPNIIDSNYALKIIKILSQFGEVKSRLGGTMGRTAVIDAALENIIDISSKLLPSESVKKFKSENFDVIFLLNYGKSAITGHTFGYKVFKNSFLNEINKEYYFNNFKLHDENTVFIQIERPGEEDGSVIEWTGNSNELTHKIADILKLKVLKPETIIKKYFSYEIAEISYSSKKNKELVSTDKTIRKIHGVSPNENIFINGVVIGKSKDYNLSIISKNGQIIDIIGGKLKKHGVEKLGAVDIKKAIVKTGLLRKSNPKPRILDKDNPNNIISNDLMDYDLKIAFIDHAAEDIYNLKNFDVVVTIGDDTTLIASDILYRFSIPVIGITDGDLDKVVEKGFKAENSMIIELEEGLDDVVGKSIFKNIFNSNNFLSYSFFDEKNNNLNKSMDYFKSKKIEDFKNQILNIVKNITSKYNIKNN